MPDPGRPRGLATRAATPDDLPACERVWRDSLNGYLVRLGQLAVPDDNPGLRRLHAHTLSTDPGLFRVATRDARVIAFGSAVRRGPVWFLSMLFVEPAEQARGLGRRLLRELLPPELAPRARLPRSALRPTGDRDAEGDPGAEPLGAPILATATDSAQPISNGLYASVGIVPRIPLLSLVGRPRPGWSPPPLPPGITTELVPLEATGVPGAVDAEIRALDREIVGFEHPEDHAFARRERPATFCFRDGGGRLVGYGYTSEVGRIGPVAVHDPALLGPALGLLLTAVEPRGASAVWLAGAAGDGIVVALDAGLRLEDFPILVCWSHPFADFARYVPISPGLL